MKKNMVAPRQKAGSGTQPQKAAHVETVQFLTKKTAHEIGHFLVNLLHAEDIPNSEGYGITSNQDDKIKLMPTDMTQVPGKQDATRIRVTVTTVTEP